MRVRSEIRIARIRWKPCWRVIPSRFPPVDLFERVADPADLEAIIAVESLTNDRLRDEVGELDLVPPKDRVSGPGSNAIMAAFTHLNPLGSRFSDGGWGVYYAAKALETAIRETVYHAERFMQATAEPKMDLDRRVVLADLDGRLRDLRGREAELPEVYDPDDYAAGQALARKLRADGANGIAYGSVRHSGGQHVAIFRPRLLSRGRQERHLRYRWDGDKISHVHEMREIAF